MKPVYEYLLLHLDKPIRPIEVGTPDGWLKIESELGIILPKDYKFFITTYGTGIIADFLIILNPFAKNLNYNLQANLESFSESIKIVKEDFNKISLFKAFPAEGGLLPWAISINGDIIAWEINHKILFDKDITVIENRFVSHENYTMSAIDFILYLIGDGNESQIIPPYLVKENTKFISVPTS